MSSDDSLTTGRQWHRALATIGGWPKGDTSLQSLKDTSHNYYFLSLFGILQVTGVSTPPPRETPVSYRNKIR